MKQTIIAAALMLSSAMASAAGYVGLEVSPWTENKATKRETGTVAVAAGVKLDNWTLDVKGDASREETTRQLGHGLTGRVKYDFGPVWVRGGVGTNWVNGGNNQNFYVYGAGTSIPVSKTVALTGSVERQNARGATGPDFNIYNVGADVEVAKNRFLSVGYQVTNGDFDSKGIKAGYTFKF